MFKWVNFEDNYGREAISGFVRDRNFTTVLDLGAGHGDDLYNVKRLNPAAELFAIESYEKYVEELTAKGVKVFSIDIERSVFPFANESVDIIICNQVLEHTKDIFWILHESSRILKKGGLFIIGVPNLAAWHNRLILFFGSTPPCIELEGNHVRGFTFKNLVNFFLKSFPGYKLVSYAGCGFYPFSGNLAKLLARRLPRLSWGIFLAMEKTLIYNSEFLDETEKRKETNFYIGKN